jgi:polar amino acid transport system substrate-binding protein
MNRTRRFVALAALAVSALPFGAQAQAALDEVIARKLIRIAIPTDFPPYGFVGTDLKP